MITISKSHLYLFVNNVETSIGRGRSVGVATGHVLVERKDGVRVPERSRIIALPHRPDRLWGPPDLLPNGYKGLFSRGLNGRGVKLACWPLSPTSADVKETRIYTSTIPYIFLAQCLNSYAQGQLSFYVFTQSITILETFDHLLEAVILT
jgi:hypothetical protein